MNSRQILKLFISSGLWRAIGSLFVLLVTLVIAKKLGAESSGLYFLSFAIITFIANLSRFGMDNAVLKLVSINYRERDSFVSGVAISAIIFSGLVCLIISLLIFYFSDFVAEYLFNNQELSMVIKKMLPYMVLSSWCIIISMVLQGMQKLIRAILITNIITNTLFIVLLTISDELKTSSVVELLLYSIIFNLICGVYLLRHLLHDKTQLFPAFKEIINLSTPFFVVVVCNQIILWLGQITVGLYGTSSDVSNFAVAQRVSMLVTFFLMSLNLVVAPKYAILSRKKDLFSLKRLVILTGRVNLAVTLPIFIVIFMYSEYFFTFFGDGYERASAALIILSVGQLFNAATGSVSFLLSMTGYEKVLRRNSTISAVVMVLLCFSLVPFYNVDGAAFATAISVALNNLLNLIGVKKHLGINSIKLI